MVPKASSPFGAANIEGMGAIKNFNTKEFDYDNLIMVSLTQCLEMWMSERIEQSKLGSFLILKFGVLKEMLFN